VRLDEEKLEALRSWGEKLRETKGEESAAVGRAILMLVEEIDRLHVELWHTRLQPSDTQPVADEVAADQSEQQVPATLHSRLRRALQRGSSPETARPTDEVGSAAGDAERTAAQAWIAALRRQK
jgi:hypothetical protein